MIDIRYIREHLADIRRNSENRLATVDFDRLLAIDEQRRMLEQQINDLRAQRNAGSKSKPSPEEIERMKAVGEQIKQLETQLEPLSGELRDLLMQVPNLTHPQVVVSANEDDNPVLSTHGQPTKFSFEPKDHVQLAETLDLIEFDRATKVSGAKFYYLKNELALLEQALIQYTMGIASKHGFTPMTTPDLARREILEGLGYSPRGESTQIYNIENSDLSLVGTAEITLGGLHAEETLPAASLPRKYVAVSHCFRTEAGAYSKFSKGIFRVHQFTKVEMFIYATPETSEQLHQELLTIEREIFEGLGLPFRVIDHCTADLGAPSYRTYDLEAWMPGKPAKDDAMGDWAEITSTSNCTDYQSRALNIKLEREDGTKEYVHTLNGTAVAVTRALIAIMENNQRADGSIDVPKPLRKLTGIKRITPKK